MSARAMIRDDVYEDLKDSIKVVLRDGRLDAKAKVEKTTDLIERVLGTLPVDADVYVRLLEILRSSIFGRTEFRALLGPQHRRVLYRSLIVKHLRLVFADPARGSKAFAAYRQKAKLYDLTESELDGSILAEVQRSTAPAKAVGAPKAAAAPASAAPAPPSRAVDNRAVPGQIHPSLQLRQCMDSAVVLPRDEPTRQLLESIESFVSDIDTKIDVFLIKSRLVQVEARLAKLEKGKSVSWGDALLEGFLALCIPGALFGFVGGWVGGAIVKKWGQMVPKLVPRSKKTLSARAALPPSSADWSRFETSLRGLGKFERVEPAAAAMKARVKAFWEGPIGRGITDAGKDAAKQTLRSGLDSIRIRLSSSPPEVEGNSRTVLALVESVKVVAQGLKCMAKLGMVHERAIPFLRDEYLAKKQFWNARKAAMGAWLQFELDTPLLIEIFEPGAVLVAYPSKSGNPDEVEVDRAVVDRIGHLDAIGKRAEEQEDARGILLSLDDFIGHTMESQIRGAGTEPGTKRTKTLHDFKTQLHLFRHGSPMVTHLLGDFGKRMTASSELSLVTVLCAQRGGSPVPFLALAAVFLSEPTAALEVRFWYVTHVTPLLAGGLNPDRVLEVDLGNGFSPANLATFHRGLYKHLVIWDTFRGFSDAGTSRAKRQ